MNVWRILVRFGGWRLALSVGVGLAGGAALAALMRLVHRALTQPAAELQSAALQFAGFLVLYFFGTITAEQALNDTSERLQWELRQDLLCQLLERPLRQLERLGLPRLAGIVGGDVRTVSDYVCSLPDAVVNLAIAIGCFSYMAWLSPLVFAFNFVFVALAAGCYVAPEKASQRISRKAAEAWDRHIGQMYFALQAFRRLLLSQVQRTDFLDNHFRPTGAEVRRLNRQQRLVHLFAERFAEAMVLGNVACLLFVLPRFFNLPAATLTGLLLAAIFVRAPLKSLLNFFPRTQNVRLSLERIEGAGLTVFASSLLAPAIPPAPAAHTFRELVFDRVGFQYESDHDQAGFAGGPFSLRIRAGEIVFIVGGNGAGKTTLAKLLCGLYAPETGQVWIDGVPIIDEAGRTAQRARFAAVFTEDPLFDHVLGVPPAEAEARGNVFIEELRLAHKVALRGTAFSTIDLSQGQRRRLLLVGALLEDRPILLLDEWAADQDPQFRLFFYDAVLPALRARGKTLVLITHDDRYFERADRVLKIENGQIVAVKDSHPATAKIGVGAGMKPAPPSEPDGRISRIRLSSQ